MNARTSVFAASVKFNRECVIALSWRRTVGDYRLRLFFNAFRKEGRRGVPYNIGRIIYTLCVLICTLFIFDKVKRNSLIGHCNISSWPTISKHADNNMKCHEQRWSLENERLHSLVQQTPTAWINAVTPDVHKPSDICIFKKLKTFHFSTRNRETLCIIKE